ncbi:tyrosine-type recombinase/integrase [Vreelandella neptunia]|uniref:Tyrosine-type recombinase/integrase n=1 Tax=Vreelandella neptunia TaxID=115551 RepID=A0ABZ0YKE5_9GAMM|nr:tyrosine-type recombinase/integrase [Halomonas neptunia]MDN3561348.1 tyrosine-type recombinase/integrase [Halomonas neptunia]WQH12582.1 tyrosine-type recombinase/integrase [Halomonas neptunia]
MNAAEFRAEQLKVLHAVQAGAIVPSAAITCMRLEDGSYHVLSRYGDDIWTLPDSLFSAGTKNNDKKLNFLRVPVAFRETLKACTAHYLLSGIEGRSRPKGSTTRKFLGNVTSFLIWLHDHRIARLSDVTPLISHQYVDFCKGLKGQKGQPLSGSTLEGRFWVVETLHILSQQSDDSMRHPWPESSAKHLAGLTGQGNLNNQEAKTEIIPDAILGPMFQSAVEWLDRADEIISVRARVEGWKSEGQSPNFIRPHLKKLGWTASGIRKAEQHLQAACMCIILITSGIRVSELCSLENQCAFKTLDEKGEPFHWIRGTSYKTGAGACEWLVTEITHRALAVIERLACLLQAQLEQRIFDLRTGSPKDPDIARLKEHAHRLFLAVTMNQENRIGTLSIDSVVTRLNTFAAQCGLDWRFAPHQFRRTFAVYAAHSAFGDLRYLRDHFKHWSLDMTTLYAMSRLQDADLYDSVGLAALSIKTDLLEHWLEPDAILVGGAAETIRAFRTKNESLATKKDRAEMAKTISPLVHLRATGVAWCTADTGGCNGGQGVEKTRCAECGNAVIDESRKAVWQGIYAQQIELRDLTDIGPGGTERVARDIKRCEAVLKGLGATEEDLADVAT